MNFSDELSKFEVGSKEHTFLEKVLEKLGPNFVRKSVEDNLREVHNNLNESIQKYFQWHILANALIRSIEQLETSGNASSLNSSDELLSSCVHPLYMNTMQKYFSSKGTSQKPKIFGLTEENIQIAFKNKKSEAEAVALKKLVEENINDFCVRLIQCTGGTTYVDGDLKNALHITIKSLESKITLLTSEEAKEYSKKQVREMIKTYYEELSKGVLLLSKLLSLHKQKLEFESNFAQFYLYRCKAVFLKIKIFELKVLEATYNQETIPALKKISEQLDQSEQKLKEEENEKTVTLERYLKLGEEYERFVDEYTRLTKCIKEQQWAIDELKARNSQYCNSNTN